jgi:hypothetical protein
MPVTEIIIKTIDPNKEFWLLFIKEKIERFEKELQMKKVTIREAIRRLD